MIKWMLIGVGVTLILNLIAEGVSDFRRWMRN